MHGSVVVGMCSCIIYVNTTYASESEIVYLKVGSVCVDLGMYIFSTCVCLEILESSGCDLYVFVYFVYAYKSGSGHI